MNNLNFLTATAGRGSSVIAIIIYAVIMIAFLWIPILNNPVLFKNKKTVIVACVVSGVEIVAVLLMRYIPSTVIIVISLVLSIGILLLSPRMKKQQNRTNAEIAHTKSNRIENLTKLKELLDSGAITQEEFDEKKKQILGQ